MNVWKIGLISFATLIVGAAVFDDSQQKAAPSPESASETSATATVAEAESELAGALQNPEKVKLMECLGVKVYADPQPEGHPPSPEDCKAILATAGQPRSSAGSGPQNPAVDDAAASLAAGEGQFSARTASAQTPSESGDPYAAHQQTINDQKVREGRDYVLQTARLVGSAVRCRVIPDDQAAGIVGEAIRSVYHRIELEFEARKAANIARNAAGDCSYWQTSPQAVAHMRERGLRAVQQ